MTNEDYDIKMTINFKLNHGVRFVEVEIWKCLANKCIYSKEVYCVDDPIFPNCYVPSEQQELCVLPTNVK